MEMNKVVLFMKGAPDAPRCGFSRQTVALLREQGVPFSHFDILTDETVRNGESLRAVCCVLNTNMTDVHDAGLKVINDWPTFPQLIVNGEFVGGLDVLKEMVSSGEFAQVVEEAKAS